MNYIGSKHRLSSFLLESINSKVNNLNEIVFCDLFAGTSKVGRLFKPIVRTVISNDLEHYGYVLGRQYIQNNEDFNHLIPILEELNSMEIKTGGFIWSNYSKEGHGERQYFSDYNAAKIDVIREHLNKLLINKRINESEFYYLLTSLVENADAVANTASTYGAYLKHLKKKASERIILNPVENIISGENHKMYNEDANDLIKKISGDVLYLDPPYNQRQYGAYYHILNTITLADIFIPKGKTGIRQDYNRSLFCRKNTVLKSFEDIIKNASFEWIFLSYNNEGLMSEDAVKSIMCKYGEYSILTKEYSRYKADSKRNNSASSTIEFLHVLHKERKK